MIRGAMSAALLAWAAMGSSAQSQATADPLQRRITVHVRDVSLRDALDRVAAAGSFRLSYSTENLPLDRRVTVWRDTTIVGEVLQDLLRPFAVMATQLPDDQIVLTPRAPEPRDTMLANVTVLDRVVVTGTVFGAPERALPVAIDVVKGREIERRGQASLSNVFDGSVPGVWMWDQAPSSMMARYASIRGASSFGISTPKVYIDGIEVANPLLLTQLTPERVERVEVIRGPQGAALYGTDAISGVVNIVSRQDAASIDGSHLLLRSEGGYANGYGAASSGVQQHMLSAAFGSNLKSMSASLGYAQSGDYIPQAYSKELRAAGSARGVGAKTTIVGNWHYVGKNAGIPESPLLAGLPRAKSDDEAQQLRSYTAGATVTHVPNEQWTVAFTGGIDGYALRNVASETTIPFFVDSALRSASGSGLRATARASAVLHTGSSDKLGGTFTFAAEHSTLRDRSPEEKASTSASANSLNYVTEWRNNLGFTTQMDLAVKNAWYFSAGSRQERVGEQVGVSHWRTLPMVGGAYVHEFGALTAKARVAYGKGIRALTSSQRVLRSGDPRRRLANPFLEPEEQGGVEGGVDLLFGSALGLHVTRFDQTATGLIQTVMIADSSGPSSGPGSGPKTWYQLQNIGRIANAGWEVQGTATAGAFEFSGALTTVQSHVKALSNAYNGDLIDGARMLGVPAKTLTGTVTWRRRGLELSSTIARAMDWVDYDRLAIAECFQAEMQYDTCDDARRMAGSTLRDYWTIYDGNTRVRAAASFDLKRGMMLTLSGDNLLNYQRGEPDSITILPGRTLTAGIRARF